MKATILIPFRDKHDHKVVYIPGEVKEFDNDRVAALAARGLVKPLEEVPKDADVVEKTDTEAKPTKGKGKPKAKTNKKDKEAVDATPKSEKVEALTETDADALEETDTENETSTDNE